MPVNVPAGLPAIEILKKENINLTRSCSPNRETGESNRRVKIALLNLMPLKIGTETDFLRILSNSPLNIDLDFISLDTHESKNTPKEHISRFYTNFSKIREREYDGFIMTGAPVERLDFEAVTYWNELRQILEWSRTRTRSSLFVCWAAQAALYHYYGVPKYPLAKKMFGIFEHGVSEPQNPLFRGFDDVFYAPHSRHTEIRRSDIEKCPELNILSESCSAGVYIVQSRNGRETFVTGHSEYAPETLDSEYRRDLAKQLPIEIPCNYYKDSCSANPPLVRWRSHANLLFINWLNYFVLCD